jgi:hypothetical protein
VVIRRKAIQSLGCAFPPALRLASRFALWGFAQDDADWGVGMRS